MSRPGFFFLVCPDAELIKVQIETLIAEHSPEGATYERHVFWADEGLGRHFWESLTLQGLFDAPRIVVLRRAQALLAEDWEKLTPVLGRFNAQIWPFFCLEAGFDRGKPKLPRPLTGKKYWTLAQKKGWLWQSAGLNGPGVVRYLKERASAKGLRFAPGAAEALALVLPADASAIRRELEKIELATPDKMIGAEAANMVTFEPETDIFAFIAALQKGRSPGEVWRQALGGGTGRRTTVPLSGAAPTGGENPLANALRGRRGYPAPSGRAVGQAGHGCKARPGRTGPDLGYGAGGGIRGQNRRALSRTGNGYPCGRSF